MEEERKKRDRIGSRREGSKEKRQARRRRKKITDRREGRTEGRKNRRAIKRRRTAIR